MIVIGVTGGLASGKSTVSKYIKEKYNAYIFDADIEAKQLLQSKKVAKKILQAFPEMKFIDNHILSSVAFKNNKSQKVLNNIIHPLIEDEIKNRIINKKNDYSFFIVDAALIIESGSLNKLKESSMKLIVIVSSKKDRKKRAHVRGNLSSKTIDKRMKLQLPDSEKIKYADFIIENNSTKSELYNNVDTIINTVTND